jgi:hypothetical protein
MLLTCASVSGRDTFAEILFKLRSLAKYLQLRTTDMSTIYGMRKTEKYTFALNPLLRNQIYLIGIHHDRMHITTAEFPVQYFQWVQDDRIPPGECLVMRRSCLFDLSKPDSRKEGCRLILTVMRRIIR